MSLYKDAREEVARMLNIHQKELTYVLYIVGIDKSYKTFEIPKKNGKYRIINAPTEKLKRIQKKLADELYNMHIEYLHNNNIKSIISHGFEKNKSIITNANVHRRNKYLLNMDILDFFPSFNFGRVQGYFEKSREFMFSKEVSTVIAQLVCFNGKLPQGAPTSPLIANLIFNIVDMQILPIAKKYKLNYTRYADDMSFSTNDYKFKRNYVYFIEELTSLLEKNGFGVNTEKTRLQYYSKRQEVTGLTVNDKINANRKFINETRAMANQLYKTGGFKINGEIGSLLQLEGRFSFINQLDMANNVKNGEKCNNKYIKKLNAREKQYQYFLFYKYFYKPQKPTIVTEGKTDIIHIKAALMKYCDLFPLLVSKNDGQYDFKISFLNKTSRLKYFLGLSEHGADAMLNIWNFYTGNNDRKNIYRYICEKKEIERNENVNPVFLLFDNEKESTKPLKKFLASTKTELEDREILKQLIYNLYLLTIPLEKDLKKCEIEDLYSDELLNVIINGKKFSRSSLDDSKNHFGKHRFSMYVLNNYEHIDFKNFLPLLKTINSAIINNNSN